MNLEKRREELTRQLELKVNQFQRLDSNRNALSNEILELRGKIQLINELISERKNEKETSQNENSKDK